MKILLAFAIGIAIMNYNPDPKNDIAKESKISFNAPLLETRWELIELSGNNIPANTNSKEMYFIFKKDSTVSGSGGCNTFSGNYSLGKNNEISFGEMVRTNIACPAIDYESKFLNALAKADHYIIKGDTFSLRNQMLNLAKFVAFK